MKRSERGITLIALVVTIVVLLILAGVSISMLTGENGIITQAQESKLQTEIGKEKEYITLSVSAIRGEKISKGDTSEITSSELQTEINKYTDEATITGSGTLTVTYESGRSYDVEQNGNITQNEELSLEEAKKIVFATGCGEALLIETADKTVYYVDDLQTQVMQKIEISDTKIITTKGIKKVEEEIFIDNEGKVYNIGDSNNIVCMSDIPENALNRKNIVEIQRDVYTMIALDSEGKVYTWGDNREGQLGNGTDIEYANEPQCISDIPGNALNGKNIVEVQNDGDTMIAIDSEGKVYTWGDNSDGQLGNGTNEDSNEPICISEIEGNALNGKNIVEVQNSNDTMIAIDSERKVYTWGDNYYGQLGNGTGGEYGDYSNEPICISDIEGSALNGKNIVEVQNSYGEMIAIDSEGKVYTWGGNREGQLGNGTDIEYANEPQCISDIPGNALNGKNIVEVQESNGTRIAIDSEGKVYTWGRNYFGRLGNRTWENSNVPICISEIEGNALNGKNIVEVQSDSDTMIAIDSEGKVYTWGDNGKGQLGNGTNEDSNEPICISEIEGNALNGKNIVEIQNSNYTMISIDNEGKLYMWGNNENGEIPISSEKIVRTPTCITDSEKTELYNKKIKTIKGSNIQYYYSISYITQEGELYNYCFQPSPM